MLLATQFQAIIFLGAAWYGAESLNEQLSQGFDWLIRHNPLVTHSNSSQLLCGFPIYYSKRKEGKKRLRKMLKKAVNEGDLAFLSSLVIMNVAMWFAAGLSVVASFNYTELSYLQDYYVWYLWSFTLFFSLL